MSKKKKKLKFTAANNIVSFDRPSDAMVSREDMFGFSDYVIARNAARMLLSEDICPHLFMQAMQDEQEYQGIEVA